MFSFHALTVCGRMQRTVTGEKSWAKSFTDQLRNAIRYDKEMHSLWPEFEVVCGEIINVIIPRLLDPLQSDGLQLKPALIHGGFWENIALDRSTKEIIVFDP
jgi:protein-ribulosamine 3-kinase